VIALIWLACNRGPWDGPPESEIEAWETLFATSISVGGRVVDASGAPIEGATVEAAGQSDDTNAEGFFSIAGLDRQNVLVSVTASGFHADEVPAHLLREIEVTKVDLGDVPLTAEDEGTVRVLFTGDVIFGRRFVDLDESTPFDQVPPDDAEALILSGDPYPGSKQAFHWVESWLDGYDYVSVNLESVVTDTPDTPHETKPYVFFTFPESLDALAEYADYANLGNNHVYDYLEPGITDTLDWVSGSGLGYAGLGSDAEEAFLPWDFELSGQRFSMLSMTSVTGSQYEVGFVATDSRGGAADLTDDEAVLSAIDDAWTLGRLPIVQAHFGKEYAEYPSSYTEGRLELLGEAAPVLIVGHHPHTPQGFGWHDGVLAAHSLGNFIFDQDRLETMLGLLFEVEFDGGHPVAARTRPIYLEDYRPRPLTGPVADWLLRQVGAVSLPYGGELVPLAGSAWIDFGSGVIEDQRSATITVTVGEDGVGIADLRGVLEPGESVVYVSSPSAGYSAQMGRDQLMFGAFEDVDVDEDALELSRWDLGGDSQFPCVEDPYRGVAAVCSLRHRKNTEDSRVWFRNRVRVVGDALSEPNKDMTLLGYRRGVDAGPTFWEVRYLASEGDREFGEDQLALHRGGSFDWEMFRADLSIPDDEADVEDPENNARAVRIIFHQSPPKRGRAFAAIDDIALVNWFAEEDLSAGFVLDAPHAMDFVRVEGQPGEVVLDVTVASLRRF